MAGCLTGLVLWVAVSPRVVTARDQGWKKRYTSDGITVSAKQRSGADLPVLRGVGILKTNLYLLLAIIDDVPRHHEWVYRLASSKVISRPDPFHIRAYLHFNFPWPTSDRDGLIDVVVERRSQPHEEVWIRFHHAVDKRVPVRKGVVRVPRSIGYTRLRWLGPNRTHVVYQIDTDPAGSLPRWLVRWISRDLPLRIMRGLRRQLRRRGRSYGGFRRRWDPRRSRPTPPAGAPMPGYPARNRPPAPRGAAPAP